MIIAKRTNYFDGLQFVSVSHTMWRTELGAWRRAALLSIFPSLETNPTAFKLLEI